MARNRYKAVAIVPQVAGKVVGRARQYTSFQTDQPAPFVHPKAQDVFQRITSSLSSEEVHLLAETVNGILNRPIRKNEFYYRGFGGLKVKSGGVSVAPTAEIASSTTKNTVDIKLIGYDDKAKIKVIKEVRAITGLGLKEAKELVEGAPRVLQKDLKPEQAEELKRKLIEAGAQVDLC